MANWDSILTKTGSSAPGSYHLSCRRNWPGCTSPSQKTPGASQSRTTCPDTVDGEPRQCCVCSVAVMNAQESCFYLLIELFISYPLKVEARLNLGSRTGTPVVRLSWHHREQQQQQAAGSRHGSAGRDRRHKGELDSKTVYTKADNSSDATVLDSRMLLPKIRRYQKQ